MSLESIMARLKRAVKRRVKPGHLPAPRKPANPFSEYAEQCQVTCHMYTHHPDVIFFSVPNEATKGALHYKASGMLPGVCDLFIDKPVAPFAGLRVEMKKPGGTVSPQQWNFITRERAAGYAAEVCYGSKAAIELIENYLRGNYK